MVRILLGYHSELVGMRLGEMLMDMKNVELAGIVFDSRALLDGLDKFEPEIAIIDMRLLLAAKIQDLSALKLRHPSVRFILMYDFPFTRFSRECLRFGAEYCFDTLHEFANLGPIIAQYNKTRKFEHASGMR